MKIKKLHLASAVQSVAFKATLNDTDHKIEDRPEYHGYLIDDHVLIPYSNVRELVFHREPPGKGTTVVDPVMTETPAIIKKSKK